MSFCLYLMLSFCEIFLVFLFRTDVPGDFKLCNKCHDGNKQQVGVWFWMRRAGIVKSNYDVDSTGVTKTDDFSSWSTEKRWKTDQEIWITGLRHPINKCKKGHFFFYVLKRTKNILFLFLAFTTKFLNCIFIYKCYFNCSFSISVAQPKLQSWSEVNVCSHCWSKLELYFYD